MIIFAEIEDREARRRARLRHYGSDILPGEMTEEKVPETAEDKYLNLYLEPVRGRRARKDEEGIFMNMHEVDQALLEIRKEYCL